MPLPATAMHDGWHRWGTSVGYILEVQNDPPRPPAYSSADIAAILADLQSTVSGPSSLNAWAESTAVPVDRIVGGADLTYIRLTAHDTDGSPIVLMLRHQTWQRAI